MIRFLLKATRVTSSARAVQLTIGLVLLSLCVLLLADLAGLRKDGTEARHQAREAMAESLALRLSLLADKAGAEAVDAAIENFLLVEADVDGAELQRAGDQDRETFGHAGAIEDSRATAITSVVLVPILDGGKPWGELRVAFHPIDRALDDIAYFGFITLGLALSFLAYLGRVLFQLDPTRAIPERVGSAFNMLVEGVIVVDGRFRVLMVNNAASRIIGRGADELVGERLEDWAWTFEEDDLAPWRKVLIDGLPVADHPIRLSSPADAGAGINYTLNCSVIRDDQDAPNGVMITLTDLSAIERKNRELSGILRKLRRSQESITRKNRELETLASQDPLTGLRNRRALLVEMQLQLQCSIDTGQPLACVMIDIDHFKRINDTHGHATGDEVICAVANTLVQQSRDGDAVGRVGGEEFVMVLPATAETVACEVAELIRLNVERLGSDVTVPVKNLTTSVGVALLDGTVTSIEQLLDRADQALYRAKNGGRNQVILYEADWADVDTNGASEHSDYETRVAAGGVPSREVELEAMLAQKSEDLDLLRSFDPESGLPRREVFLDRVVSGLDESRRAGTALGVLSLALRDSDRLEATLGHAIFEDLKRTFIERVRDGLRQADLVAEIASGHTVSHSGGESLGVLLENLDDAAGALAVMTRMRRALSEPFVVGKTRVLIGMSIGAAFYPNDGETAESLLSMAVDARAEAARQPDKIAFRFASDALGSDARTSLEMESDLYLAIEGDQFSVHYQPKLDMRTRRICGMEALARWQHPEKGWISPVDFIPVAEGNGLIKELSAFVMKTAFAQLAIWHAKGFHELHLSMNISATQLRDPALVQDILGAIETAGVAASSVEIELTETAVIDSPQRARIALGQLRSAGVSVSMDDFGTGYTSLALLAELPLDTVKIDRSFVDAMGKSERNAAIVRSIIDMAHALDLSVVGEGVETEAQLDMLAGFGCNEAQGYLISRPRDMDGMSAFLAESAASDPTRRIA